MRPSTSVVGIDVGGANLKLALWQDAHPKCVSQSFPLWKHPEQLGAAVGRLLEQLIAPESLAESPPVTLAVTMTGELADCFATRREGVQRILCQLASVVPAQQISVYAVGGDWLTVDQAVADPWHVAASNWHALASWIGRWQATADKCRRAILIDIGSTTVDILPLKDGQCATGARTDRERLEQRQLVYTGARRTPVCAITSRLILNERSVPVMAEFFATADDAYLATALVEEDLLDADTADGRPRSAVCARARLARMIGEDSESLTASEINGLAEQIIAAQTRQVADAIQCNLAALSDDAHATDTGVVKLIFSGQGWALFQRARALCESPHELLSLRSILSVEASRCAPALAVAWLRAAAG